MKIDFNTAFKSGTMRALMLICVVIAMQFYGIGQEEVARTIDEMQPPAEGGIDVQTILNVALLVLTGRAAYGRAVAKKPIIKKKEGEG